LEHPSVAKSEGRTIFLACINVIIIVAEVMSLPKMAAKALVKKR